jgi:hypothetical protein
MEVPTYFSDFLTNIRPTSGQKTKMKSEHRRLRDLIWDDEDLSQIILSTFIQGSYRRLTGNRPLEGALCDVDVIVATTMHEADYTPSQALEKFRPFLERNYPKQHHLQGRSWCIIPDDEVAIDLVPTSAPSEAVREAIELTKATLWDFPDEPASFSANAYSEILLETKGGELHTLTKAAAAEEWKKQPLRISDREAKVWDDTHPLEQIRWTWDKSRNTNGHYVNVAKAIKRWRQVQRLSRSTPGAIR